MIAIPQLQFRTDSIIQYTQLFDAPLRPIQDHLTEILKEQTTYTGRLCPGAKKRLIKCVELFLMSTPRKTVFNPVTRKEQSFRLNFITLTIPQTNFVDGKTAHKQLLEPFLQWLRRRHGMTSYIWKAELQKRGQLHYHITFDAWVHWRQIRTKWNTLLKDNGYLDEYYKKKRHYDPNSTDIHAVYKIKNLSGYIIKEVTKDFQNKQSIAGKVWDCSLNLKTSAFFTCMADSGYEQKISDQICKGLIEPVYTDHCTIYRFKQGKATKILNDLDKKDFQTRMKQIRAYQIQRAKVSEKKQIERIYKPFTPIRKAKIEIKIDLQSEQKNSHNLFNSILLRNLVFPRAVARNYDLFLN